ncbi:MAG: type II toxin-antitoxin system VapC family toxin [Candidatus Eremiobacteraeota bacterium]|nr:type II toxin-antitoxin system VapC family toxin [Candidatus Eremiobacteraeota bacterium]
MIVIDACTIVSALLEDEDTPTADVALDYVAKNGAAVPGNFVTEVVNALGKAERRGRLGAVKADIVLTEALTLPFSIELPDPHAILSATRSYGITAYDAAYLALALQLQVPLATVDRALRSAAKAAKCRWKMS